MNPPVQIATSDVTDRPTAPAPCADHDSGAAVAARGEVADATFLVSGVVQG